MNVRKILFSLFLLMGAVCSLGIEAQVVKIYKDGAMVYSLANADSVVFCQAPPLGVFSVSADKQVSFAPGNLQYQASTDTWRFAEHQYDYIGDANSNISATYTGWIDLFGWGTGNNPTQSSTYDSDYPTFVDWGSNKIGDDAPNAWRTLTIDEWRYLCYTRANADNLIGVARLNLSADGSEYVNGLILLPDDWGCPAGVTFKSGFATEYGEQAFADYQTIVLSDWQKMEAVGGIFLPVAGVRNGKTVYFVGFRGSYWSTSLDSTGDVMDLDINPSDAYIDSWNERSNGQSVRLVQDLK